MLIHLQLLQIFQYLEIEKKLSLLLKQSLIEIYHHIFNYL